MDTTTTTSNHVNESGDVGQGMEGQENKPKSMVEQHRAKLLLAKQEIAMSKMNVLLPGVREGLLREALEASNWSVETSLQLLEGFLTARAAELASIDEKIRARQAYLLEKAGIFLPEVDGKGRGTKDVKGHGRRKTKKRRKHTRHRSRSRGRREKRESRYGRYGVIKETDMEEKRTEFALWAMDEKKVDVEGLSQRREKELFSEFVEDFNTATLPHRKYYDVDTYQKEKARRRRDGYAVEEEHRVFDDEAERQKEREQQRQVEQSRRFREIYEELQRGGDKANDMREQELLRQKRALAYRTGDIEQAENLSRRLRPDP